MVLCYGNYIPHFAEIARPLYCLYRKNTPFVWSPECQQAIKVKLTSPPVLRRPDPELPYILQVEWSPIALGAVLAEEDWDGEEHHIAFASKLLKGPELNYPATEGECFAVVSFVEHFRHFRTGVPFTEHWALQWLMRSPQQNGRLARWALKLQGLDFKIGYRKGSHNGNADALCCPPIACAEDSVGMLTAQSGFGKNDSADCITYASDSGCSSSLGAARSALAPVVAAKDAQGRRVQGKDGMQQHLAQEGSDSGPSVCEELACEVCQETGRDNVMLLCHECSKGYHTDCLEPPLSEVPEGGWYCTPCKAKTVPDKTSEVMDPVITRTDITRDYPTLQYLQIGAFPEDATAQEQTRILAKAPRFAYKDDQLIRVVSRKPTPDLADRKAIVAQCHSYGHYGIEKTTSIVQNHYWWWGMKDQVKECLRA